MSGYKSPLAGFENAEPLPDTFNADGKSLLNTPGPKSSSYEAFPEPFKPNKNGFDFHGASWAAYASDVHGDNGLYCSAVYYMQAVPAQAQFAKELHERVRREFPEVCSLSEKIQGHVVVVVLPPPDVMEF